MIIKPNFFIVGAPKCGTTALSYYLNERSDVFLSKPKEPTYFAKDLPSKQYTNSLNAYLSLFNKADNKVAVGEASTWYMYSKVAAANIRQFSPNAKIIIMVRNPIDMLQSLHNQLVFNFEEDIKDFTQAWKKEKKRKHGQSIPETCSDPKLLLYSEMGLLGEQAQLFLNEFPKNQIFFIIFDDFIKNTKLIYEKTCTFLGVPIDHRYEFPCINARKTHRFELIARVASRPPILLSKTLIIVKKIFRIHRPLGIMEFIEHKLSIPIITQPINQELIKELKRFYKNDVNKLSLILNRNLDHWVSLD